MTRPVVVLSTLGLLLLALLATACEGDEITVASQQGEAQGISVSGEGNAFGAPDLAVLTLGVSALEPSVKEARDQAASAMEKVVDSLKDNGVDEKDIQSTRFSIQPEYDYTRDGQELLGYRVTNIVTAKVRDIDSTGEALDDAVAAGGDLTEVQGISFTIEEPDALQDEAREEAMEDAKVKAERLAELAGVKLGKPISIREYSNAPPVSYERAPMPLGEAEDVATPIEAGELEVALSIDIVYVIE